jgi:hypothetical protein
MNSKQLLIIFAVGHLVNKFGLGYSFFFAKVGNASNFTHMIVSGH